MDCAVLCKDRQLPFLSPDHPKIPKYNWKSWAAKHEVDEQIKGR
jgi:hypothetical protein